MPDDDFDRRLDRRLSAYESRIPDAEAPAPGTKMAPRLRGALVGVGALGVVAAGILALVLINAPRDDAGEASPSPMASTSASSPPASSVAPSEASRSAAVGTATPAPSPVAGWAEAGMFGGNGTVDTVRSMTASPSGFIAVGTRYEADTMPIFGVVPHSGHVWHSVDGSSWEDTTPSGTFADTDLRYVYTATDGQLIAIGEIHEGDFGESITRRVWESVDGLAWTPASLDLPDGYLVEVTNGTRGWLAAIVIPAQSTQLWHSADGRSWELVREGPESISDIGAGDEGFVAIGTRGEGDAAETFTIASSDGQEWIDARTPPSDARLVAPLGGDWVATGASEFINGTEPPSDSAVWFSANGLEWAEVGSFPLNSVKLDDDISCSEFPVGLDSAGGWLVASTLLTLPCSEGGIEAHGAQWISADGLTWETLPFPTVADPSLRGSTSRAVLLTDDGALILAGQSHYRAAFWFNARP
jgi:hypothetical protein